MTTWKLKQARVIREYEVTELLSEAIDWEAVRGLRSGARSLLASLPDRKKARVAS